MPRRRSTLRRNLLFGTLDGTAFSVMVGVGEWSLPAFIVALSHGEVASGLVATVPMLLGGVMQLVTPWGWRAIGTKRRWVIAGATTQAFAFVPLAIGAAAGAMPVWAVFLFATLYWAGGMGGGPAWTSWMASLIPQRIRARYFSRRGRINHVGVFAGFLAAGATLHIAARNHQSPALPFAILFGAACIARLVSSYFLVRQTDPPPEGYEDQILSPGQIFQRLRHSPEGRVIVFLLAAQVAAQLAQPFFNPYMLEQLRLKDDYAGYTMLLGTAFFARILVLPTLGVIAHRFGARRVLWIGGLGLIPLPLLWTAASSYAALVGVQFISGAIWGAFELGLLLMCFEALPANERVSLLTFFNLANSAAQAAGSILGGILLASLGNDAAAYAGLFVVSAIARAGAAALMFRIRPLPIEAVPLATSTVAVRVGAGAIDQPELESLPKP